MTKALKVSVAASAAMVCLATATIATAQTAGAAGGGTATAGGTATGQVGMALPAAPAAPAAGTQGDSDHDAVVGRLAVGYLGRRSMLIGNASAGPAGPGTTRSIDAPVIGVRYWINQLLGIDAGLGFYNSSGSNTTNANGVSTSVDKQGDTAFIIHGGVPLSLASSGHFSFQIVPELNVGFASSTLKGAAPGAPDTDFSGFHFDVGARAGAEIQFGFIGIPQLSLQGSIGLLLSMDQTKGTLKTTPETSFAEHSLSIGTSVYDNPWNIFTSNVAALYYF